MIHVRYSRLLQLCCASLLLSTSLVHATLRTWTGATSGNWSTTSNWTPAGTPQDGDDLIFPAGAANLINTNNITDLRLNSLQFNGASGNYFLRGNSLSVSNGVVAAHTAGDNNLDFATITNAASQTYTIESGGTLDVNANVVLLGVFTLTVNNEFTTRFDGIISGTGNISKSSAGLGVLAFGGIAGNTYSGNTTVNGGTLQLGKSGGLAVPGDLTVGSSDTVTYLAHNQVADAADVTVNGTLNLNGFNDAIGTLTMSGGLITTAAGVLTNGNITTLASATVSQITGNLHLGTSTRTFNVAGGTATPDLDIQADIAGGSTGSFPLVTYAGIIKAGAGSLTLNGNNTYAGRTTVNEGILTADSDTALGSGTLLFGDQSTVVNSNAVLVLNSASITNELLTLNSPNATGALQVNATGDWIGPVVLNTNVFIEASSALQIGGAISGPGGFTKIGASTLRLIGTNANTYAGTTIVQAGTLELEVTGFDLAIPGDLVIGDGVGTDTVRTLVNNQIDNSSDVTMASGSILDLGSNVEALGTLTMTGASVTGTGNTLNLLPGGLTVNASTITSTISKTLWVNSYSINVADGAASPDLRITGALANNGFTKLGAGTLRLEGAGTYTGTTVISAGTVEAANNDSLGTSAGSTVVSNGASLFLDVGVNTLGEVLTLNGSGTSGEGALHSIGIATIATNLVLGSSSTIQVSTNGISTGALTINGVVSGTGNLTKIGVGTLVWGGAGDNTYAGTTFVNQGTLQFNKSSGFAIEASQALVIGDSVGGSAADKVVYLANQQLRISNPITINSSGVLDLNGFNDDVGAVTMIGGDIATGAGTITFSGNVSATSVSGNASFINGLAALSGTRTFTVTNGPVTPDLNLNAHVSGTGSLVKAENGTLSLLLSNSFSGAVTVNDGTLHASDNFAFGTTASGVAVNNDAILELAGGLAITNEALALNSSNGTLGALWVSDASSNYWSGPITLSSSPRIGSSLGGSSLNLAGPISGTSGFDRVGNGILVLSGASANTYVGLTRVVGGRVILQKTSGVTAIPGDLDFGAAGSVNADVVEWRSSNQVADGAAVTMGPAALWEMLNYDETIGSLSGSGNMDLGSLGDLYFGDSTSTTFSGSITGPGGQIHKQGSGTVTFTGISDFGPIGGPSDVTAGTLVVNGTFLSNSIAIGATGTLGGSGTVAHISSTAGGDLIPGTSPGILTCSNLTLNGVGSTFVAELNGATPGLHDQVVARGTVNLTNASLSVSVGGGYLPVQGVPHIIINNDGGDAVLGTFSGLPEGGILDIGAYEFVVSYLGGSGNDVSLTLTNRDVVGALAEVGGGNGNPGVEPNECNLLRLPVINNSGVLMTNIGSKLQSLTPGVVVVQPFSTYPNIPAGATRTNNFEFQISTVPGFPCGTNINLELEISSSTHGIFKVPFTIPTGVGGTPVPFTRTYGGGLAIPDAGFVDSTINLGGITSPLKKVTVLLHITHTAVADLDISLIGPDGTTVNLSSDNGGVASDYGVDCTDVGRTRFDSDAATSITAATAPFVGTFRPEQSLTVFNGKSGADVNGIWTLRVADDTGGAIGSLRCWTLVLTPTTCAPGSGMCELCPDVVVTGSLGTSSPQQLQRLFRDGSPSVCGVLKTYPGTAGAGNRSFEQFSFVNGPTNACITVSLVGATSDLMSVAYGEFFDPLVLSSNYLADAGSSTASSTTPRAYSFIVGANRPFVVTVHEVNAGTGGPFELTVTGGDCRPVLNIGQVSASQVALNWTTAAAGYKLERTNNLFGGPLWDGVPNAPVVIGSRFVVTNVIAPSNTFFRLRKPLP